MAYKQQKFFLSILKAETSKVKTPARSSSGEGPLPGHWWLLTISSHSRRGIHGVYLRLLQRHKHSNHSTVVSIMDSECQQTFSTRYTFSCPSTTFSRKWVSVNFSFKCFLLSANTLCIFCSFLTLLRISVQSSLGKCHIALEKYMGYF